MKAVLKKEIRGYFLSPIAYIFSGTFMLIAGIFFSLTNILGLSSDFSSTLGSLTFVFIIIIPVLTMRMISQEQREKTDQLLLTSGVPIFSIILGKYFAAVIVYIAALGLSLVFPITISLFGTALFGELLCSYIGFLLLGLVMIAIGMLISSLTQSQITAAILTAAAMLLLWVADAALSLITNEGLRNILSWFSFFSRLEPFILGKLAVDNVVYYISFAGFFVYTSYLAVEKRRWR
ncbi:MAG: ABC transporter permease [Clostridia bacterium]|nr:ABC transporter permease [Clostridia bacterium]